MAGKRGDDVIRCSFCNKAQAQVQKLIAGPNGAYINIDNGDLRKCFWTSSIDGQGNSGTAWRFRISYHDIILETDRRMIGWRILPVCE